MTNLLVVSWLICDFSFKKIAYVFLFNIDQFLFFKKYVYLFCIIHSFFGLTNNFVGNIHRSFAENIGTCAVGVCMPIPFL